MLAPLKTIGPHFARRRQTSSGRNGDCACARRSCLCNAPLPTEVPTPAWQQLRRSRNQQQRSKKIIDYPCDGFHDTETAAKVKIRRPSMLAQSRRESTVLSTRFQQISSRIASKRAQRSVLPTLLNSPKSGPTSFKKGKQIDDDAIPAISDPNLSLKTLEQLRMCVHAALDPVTTLHNGGATLHNGGSDTPSSSTDRSSRDESSDGDGPTDVLPEVVEDLATCLRGAFRNATMELDPPALDQAKVNHQECVTESDDEDCSSRQEVSGNSGARDFLAQSSRFKAPLSDRLKRVELRRSERMNEIRDERTRELKKRRYNALQPSEIEEIELAFRQFDKNSTDFLCRAQIIPCLMELGIVCRTYEEKQELKHAFQCTVDCCSRPPCNWRLAQSCCQSCQQSNGISHSADCARKFKEPLAQADSSRDTRVVRDRNIPMVSTKFDSQASSEATTSSSHSNHQQSYHIHLFDFALTVLPEVRQRLMDLRSAEMLKQFFQFDLDGSGTLSRAECGQVARVFSIDRRLVDDVCAKVPKQGIDFEQFQIVVSTGCEMSERRIRLRERAVQEQLGICDEVFEEFRYDLMVLYHMFQMYDVDGSGTLSNIEIATMIKEFGLAPRTAREKEEIETLLFRATLKHLKSQAARRATPWARAQDQVLRRFPGRCRTNFRDEGLNFEEFLGLVGEIRTYKRSKNHTEYVEKFERYDKDNNGKLSLVEIWNLLSDLAFVPLNYKEQTELAYLIHVSDEDGSGHINFREFQTLCQRIEEKLKSLRFEEEMEHAMRLGFSDDRIRELRLIFDSLDVDGSCKLSENEVRDALVLSTVEIPQDAFKRTFIALDSDHDGELNLKEFMTFMKMMRDGEGLFALLPRRSACLPSRVLRRILEYFDLSKMYISTLSNEDLVQLFNDFMGISDPSELHKELGIATVDELLEVAKKRAGQSTCFRHWVGKFRRAELDGKWEI